MALVIRGACTTMSAHDIINPQGLRKAATNTKRKPPGQMTGFTFVDQSSDLRSIADKKIVDSDQRHLIRSHVMQKVRKDERLQGKKRPTGRDASRKDNSSLSTTTSSPANSSPRSSSRPSPRSDQLSSVTPERDFDFASPVGSVKSENLQLVHIPHAPSQGRVDPFNTLPGGRELSNLTNELIGYCFHTFIPMTFPVETRSKREFDLWRVRILQSQTANSATFFGLMAMVAAHQAINSGRHRDLKPTRNRPTDLLLDDDFAIMKSEALQATQARIARDGWNGPTVEAIFSLIGGEQMLGNFEEARFHLSALRKFFVRGEDLDPESPASNWIPLTDVKGAIGTMSRPLFRLPWTPERMPQDLLEKLFNWHAPEMSLIGSAFEFVDGIGPHMQCLLQQAAVLCRFCQRMALSENDFTAQEYEILRRKTLEMDYDVLSYIYPGSPTDDEQVPNKINIIEQIARLAILGFTSTLLTNVHPSAGVGRALTHFQSLAIQEYATTLQNPPNKTTAQFIIWALMVFAQCARKQPEERHFVNSIAWCSRWAGIENWSSLAIVCSSFLYVPACQQRVWQETWAKACQLQQPRLTSQQSIPMQSQPQMVVLRSHQQQNPT